MLDLYLTVNKAKHFATDLAEVASAIRRINRQHSMCRHNKPFLAVPCAPEAVIGEICSCRSAVAITAA